MAQIDLGRILPVFKGKYNELTQYEKLDIVYYKGSSYVANSNMKGIAPDSTASGNTWQLVASIDNQQLAHVQQQILDNIATNGRLEVETIILSGSDLSSTVSAVADLQARLAAAEDKIERMQWSIDELTQHDAQTGEQLTDISDEIIALQDRVTALENKK